MAEMLSPATRSALDALAALAYHARGASADGAQTPPALLVLCPPALEAALAARLDCAPGPTPGREPWPAPVFLRGVGQAGPSHTHIVLLWLDPLERDLPGVQRLLAARTAGQAPALRVLALQVTALGRRTLPEWSTHGQPVRRPDALLRRGGLTPRRVRAIGGPAGLGWGAAGRVAQRLSLHPLADRCYARMRAGFEPRPPGAAPACLVLTEWEARHG